jgi:HAD superfamily hydrolase (TIGR01509 family)
MVAVKGFFFDLDGTLVDTHEANYLAYHHAVKFITSVELDEKLKLSIKSGENSNSFLPKLLPNTHSNVIDQINIKKKELYPQFLEKSVINDYLAGFLRQMSDYYVTALVTTAKKPNALAVLRAHDLEKYFSFMIFGDDVTSMKPDPEAYNLALKHSSLKASEVIAFEDSEKGIQAARAANINTIHIKKFL